MGIFDRFTSKSEPRRLTEMNVTFTREESEAISTHMAQFAAIANADAPEGESMYIHPKAHDGMTAKALAEYVEDLVSQLGQCNPKQAAIILDKAVKAQLKAYAVHNLPVYLFQAAGMFELIGDTESATKFFRLFLQMQNEFAPIRLTRSFSTKPASTCQGLLRWQRRK